MDTFKSVPPPILRPELTWKYKAIGPGEGLSARIAGPLVGVETHWAGRSRPCRRRLTEGFLACPGCQERQRVNWLGYQPLLDQYGRRVVVTVSPTTAYALAEMTPGTSVRLSRGKVARSALRVELLTGPDSLPKSARGTYKADIWPWLLQLWDDDELTTFWHTRSNGES